MNIIIYMRSGDFICSLTKKTGEGEGRTSDIFASQLLHIASIFAAPSLIASCWQTAILSCVTL